MILCRITGSVYSTHKNDRLKDNRLLRVQPVELDGDTPRGSSYLALDRVDAGEGDLVLVVREGGSARMAFADDKIPLQAFIVGVVDRVAWDQELAGTRAVPG